MLYIQASNHDLRLKLLCIIVYTCRRVSEFIYHQYPLPIWPTLSAEFSYFRLLGIVQDTKSMPFQIHPWFFLRSEHSNVWCNIIWNAISNVSGVEGDWTQLPDHSSAFDHWLASDWMISHAHYNTHHSKEMLVINDILLFRGGKVNWFNCLVTPINLVTKVIWEVNMIYKVAVILFCMFLNFTVQ